MSENLEKTDKSISETFEKMSEKVENIFDNKIIEDENINDISEADETEQKQIEDFDPEATILENIAIQKTEQKHESDSHIEFEGESDEVDLITEIKEKLIIQSKYSFLVCGRHIKDKINKETLSLFYKEFVIQGISSKMDSDIIELIKEYLGLK